MLPILIFSVYQSDRPRYANRDNHECIKSGLIASETPFKELIGVYKGLSERSFLVPLAYKSTVEGFCKKFNQQCYLVSYKDRFSELIFADGTIQPIGTLTCVSKTEARQSQNYTYDPMYNKYYTTV